MVGNVDKCRVFHHFISVFHKACISVSVKYALALMAIGMIFPLNGLSIRIQDSKYGRQPH